MTRPRTSSRQRGTRIFLLTFCMLLGAAFAALFYVLYERGLSSERERVEHDVDLLSSSLQATLLSNERFFLVKTRDEGNELEQRQRCRDYVSSHPEIAAVTSKTPQGALQWAVTSDSSPDSYPQPALENVPLFSYAEKWESVYYSRPVLVGQSYYFKASFDINTPGVQGAG